MVVEIKFWVQVVFFFDVVKFLCCILQVSQFTLQALICILDHLVNQTSFFSLGNRLLVSFWGLLISWIEEIILMIIIPFSVEKFIREALALQFFQKGVYEFEDSFIEFLKFWVVFVFLIFLNLRPKRSSASGLTNLFKTHSGMLIDNTHWYSFIAVATENFLIFERNRYMQRLLSNRYIVSWLLSLRWIIDIAIHH